MMALELKARLEKEFERTLPFYPSVSTFHIGIENYMAETI